jgi:hypothetical protein
MSWRYLGSGRWRNYLGLWIGNGLGGIACALVLSVSVLACLWFSQFCLVPLPLFVLVLLVFACLCLSLVFAVVRLVSDERALCILGRGEVLADASI